MSKPKPKPKQPKRRYGPVKPEMAFLNASPSVRNRQIKRERQRSVDDRTALINTLASIYGYRCLCCGATKGFLTLDHVRPLSLGGTTVLSNLQLLCSPCNQAKGNRIIDYRGTLP